jgi:hypothetical protein
MRRLAALLLGLLAGCSKPTKREHFLPAHTRWVLEAPDSVIAYRIDVNKFDGSRYPKGQQIPVDYPDFPVIAEAPVEGDRRAQLLRLFANDGSFEFVGKGCIPEFGVKLRFRREGSFEEFYMCFKCAGIYRRGTNPDGWADFDPSVPSFKKLVQELFPNDPDIKNLK